MAGPADPTGPKFTPVRERTTMRLAKFTRKPHEATQEAQRLAAEHWQQELLPEHLLVALLEQPEGIVPPILQKLGANAEAVRAEARRAVERLPKVGGAGGGERFSPRLHAMLE